MKGRFALVFHCRGISPGRRLIAGFVTLLLTGTMVSSGMAFDLHHDPIEQIETVPTAITSRFNDQLSPRAAYSPYNNQYLVVWDDAVQPNDHDIYARRVDNLGIPMYEEIPIGTSYAMDIHPDIAYSPYVNQYLVVWENEYSVTDHDIFAQRVDMNGNLVGGEIHVAYSSYYDLKPMVVFNPGTHEYLVVFERNLGSDEFPQKDVMAQRVSENGAIVGGEIIIANGYLDEQVPSVACDGLNYLVTWQGDYLLETNIYGQRVSYDGLLVGSPISISVWGNNQYAPRVTYNSDFSQYFVVWEDHYFSPSEIYGQRLDVNGNLHGSQVSVAVGGEKNRTNPDVAYMHNTFSYLVVWQFEYSLTDHDIYSRRIAYDGSHPESERAISTTGAEENHPALASNAGEQGLVVWEDWRNAYYTQADIYGSVETVYVPVLSGIVYNGAVGDMSTPLVGALVELGCSDNQGVYGNTIAWSVTDTWGQYFLPGYIQCEYYNIVETDPAGFYSVGGQTTGGYILNSSWIYYTHPLVGKELGGNYFWDLPEGGGDVTPPGNWTNFQPEGWVNDQTPTVSEQVEDTQSGLDVSTAEYQFSINGGTTWSGWLPAEITGFDGTTDPQVISADVPFDQDSGPNSLNQVQFRVADIAGNMGTSSIHQVMIDSVVPINPSYISSSTHQIYTWSTNPNISLYWVGAYDERSGLNGFSTSFDHSPTTIPDIYRDTIDPAQQAYAYIDSNDWWFHVRSLDNAGNAASGAKHIGPFYIDSQPPTAWFISQGGHFNVPNVTIVWDGNDNLSGLSGYDVQTNVNGSGWYDWRVMTQDESGIYYGTGGDSVQFRVRAHDVAGGTSDWSPIIVCTFGITVTARVRNESGANISGAKVFHNEDYVGLTSQDGTITVPYVLIGDTISAFHLVYTAPAGKSNHGRDGSISWSWRVYQTSINIPNSGDPQLFTVTNTGVQQEITVRKDQPLIGVHIIAVVTYDASSIYLDDLRQGLVNASHYLYDVTDGQMIFEVIEIFDDLEMGPSNDYVIYSNNSVHPETFLGRIAEPTGRMMFPPNYRGEAWSNRSLYGIAIHEFGHYGLWLDDEYKIRSGEPGGFCTLNRGTDPADEPTRASIMDNSDNASELCSDADPTHQHNSNTFHDATYNGETTWQTVMRVYADNTNPIDWIMKSPDTRHVPVVPGPTNFPVTELIKTYVHDNFTNVCAPYQLSVTDSNGQPVGGAMVYVDASSGKIYDQGKTDANGHIWIRGHHNNDTLRVEKALTSWTSPISCTPGGTDAMAGPDLVILEPDPFEIQVNTLPLSNVSIEVQVYASVNLSTSPQVTLWQDAASQPIVVPLTYDSGTGLYTGMATLDPGLDMSGNVHTQATDNYGQSVTRLTAFNLQRVDSTHMTHLRSSDNHMEIYLQPGSLMGDPAVTIQLAQGMSLEQGTLRVIGSPYTVVTSNGEYLLSQPAVLNIYFSNNQLKAMQAEKFGIYRWDEINEIWNLVSTNIDLVNRVISAEIDQLGTFAILAPPLYYIHIPLISR